MYQRSRQIKKRKKIMAALVAVFILGNMVLVTPAFASTVSGQRLPTGANGCWPIWPFCSTPTPLPTPTIPPLPTPVQTGTPGILPTGVPLPGSTPTPTPTGPAIHLSAASSFTMTATQIVGTNAHLNTLADPSHPILTFSSVTIQGLKITHLSFILTVSGTATGSGVAIKTSVFKEFVSGLVSFTNKADLVILLAGGTVPRLTMKNVSLQVDRYVDMQSFTAQGLSLSL